MKHYLDLLPVLVSKIGFPLCDVILPPQKRGFACPMQYALAYSFKSCDKTEKLAADLETQAELCFHPWFEFFILGFVVQFIGYIYYCQLRSHEVQFDTSRPHV